MKKRSVRSSIRISMSMARAAARCDLEGWRRFCPVFRNTFGTFFRRRRHMCARKAGEVSRVARLLSTVGGDAKDKQPGAAAQTRSDRPRDAPNGTPGGTTPRRCITGGISFATC